MLLKDCPVGSVVRLVSIKGKLVNYPWWTGCFTVEKGYLGNFIIDNDGTPRKGVHNDPDFQFEIVHPAPEPRITFTVGGQEFYVGQRVWSKYNYTLAPVGMPLDVVGSYNDEYLVTRVENKSAVALMGISDLSTTPPAPHEWKRGDWARHEDGRMAFVCGAAKLHGEFGPTSLMVSFEKEAITNIPASEFTFISHSEPPE